MWALLWWVGAGVDKKCGWFYGKGARHYGPQALLAGINPQNAAKLRLNECFGLLSATQNEDPSELQLTVPELRSRGSGAWLDVREGSMPAMTLLPGA